MVEFRLRSSQRCQRVVEEAIIAMRHAGASAEAPAISVTNLTKSYGRRRVVDGLSFSVGPGEIFALLGPNGAGKTTTVEILEGYRVPDGGEVSVLGLDPRRHGRLLKQRVGLMLQEGGLYPGIRVGEAVRLFAAYYSHPLDPNGLLELAGLAEHARAEVHRLSGGQKQRLSMALALVGKPEAVFLDEPTAGMDPAGRATTWKTIRGLQEQGTTVMLTTHFMEEAEQLADRIAIIDRGRLVATGTPASLTEGKAGIEFRTDRSIDTARLASALGIVSVSESGPGRYGIDEGASPDLIAGIARWMADNGVLVTELSTGRRSLEAIFLEVTAGDSG